jgi:hypothetical protein
LFNNRGIDGHILEDYRLAIEANKKKEEQSFLFQMVFHLLG